MLLSNHRIVVSLDNDDDDSYGADGDDWKYAMSKRGVQKDSRTTQNIGTCFVLLMLILLSPLFPSSCLTASL